MLLLCGCRTVIQEPYEEIRRFDWRCELDNGDVAELCFDGSDARLSAKGDGLDIDICGLCVADDSALIICDKASGINYRFAYVLHGDRVELSYDDVKLEFLKIN